jgi:hypothetical protein
MSHRQRTSRFGHDAASDDRAVIAWRRRQLIAAGFGERQAARLAATPGIDLLALLDLVGRGCPPELAVRILAPISAQETES